MADADDIKIQDYVPLPALPDLAVVLEGGSRQEFDEGEVLNIISGNADCSMLYAVARGSKTQQAELREGWISGNAVKILSDEEQAKVESCWRLPLYEVLQRSSFVTVAEDWIDHSPASLSITAGEILQVSLVQKGWAFGWPVKAPRRSGWFRLCDVRNLESSMMDLGQEEELSLCDAAVNSLLELLQSADCPTPRIVQWEERIPDVVAASERSEMREWRKRFAAEDEARTREAEGPRDQEAPAAQPPQTEPERSKRTLLIPEEPPEASCCLVVCKAAFKPPKSVVKAGIDCSALLALEVGDLVRVVSLMLPQQSWYCGYLEGQDTDTKGWFPARNVELLDKTSGGKGPLQQLLSGETPPLPQVPKKLLSRW